MSCEREKEFLSHKGIPFTDRNIRQDPAALVELQRLGARATPVTIIGGEVVIGFDRGRLERLLDPTRVTTIRLIQASGRFVRYDELVGLHQVQALRRKRVSPSRDRTDMQGAGLVPRWLVFSLLIGPVAASQVADYDGSHQRPVANSPSTFDTHGGPAAEGIGPI